MLAQLNTGTRDGLLRVLSVSLSDMPIFVTQLGRSHIERMNDLDKRKHSLSSPNVFLKLLLRFIFGSEDTLSSHLNPREND